MQVTVQSGEGLERRMTVELPAEEINLEVEKRLKDLSKRVRLDGFRPGKVPLRIVRTRYGLQVQQEVFGEKVESSFAEAASKESLRPAGVPKIEPQLDQGQGEGRFAYTAVFEVLPEVEIHSLTEHRVKRPVAEVGDENIQQMIETLRKQRQTWEDVERASQDGDRLTISFKGMLNGEVFQGGEANDVPLVLGSGSMIDGFESGLTGAGAGDERTLNLKFPDDYRVTHLAGKDVVFEVKISKVAEPVLPAVDEDFAKTFGVESGDLELFRADIRNNMERELKQRVQAKLKEQAMDVLLAAHPIDIPDSLVQQEINALREQTKKNVGGAGKMELPASLFEEQAKRRVALGLILAEVVKNNRIAIDQARVNSTIEEMAASYEDPSEVVEYYKNNHQQRASVENLVLEEQVVDWVLEQVQVEDVPSTFKEVTEGAA